METKTNFDQYAEFKQRQIELAEMMGDAAVVIDDLNMQHYKQNLEKLSKKVHNDAFKIQIVGTFKNGKSTFINSFLGEDILPAYSLPCTAVINEVKWGAEKKAVIHFKNPLPEKLPEKISADAIAHIVKYGYEQVPPLEVPYDELESYAVIPFDSDPKDMILESPYEKIELFWPLELLENGIEIIDSPGLNEHATRTKVTMDYLSKADAIIFVLNAQQICSQEEMRFIENNLKAQGFNDPFFVVNRFDCISSEKERAMMKKFVVSKLGSYTSNEIYFVSALNALQGKTENNSEKYASSGMMEFEARLSDFLTKEKGKAKLSQPARELKRILSDEALFKAIPAQRNLLATSLDEVKERYKKAEPQLNELRVRKEQMYNKLMLKIEQAKPEFKRAVSSNYLNLADMIPVWIDEVEPVTKLGIIPDKAKAAAVVREISDIVSVKIEEQQIEWRTGVLEPLVNEKAADILGGIETELGEFYKELDDVNIDICGGNYDTNDVPAWQRVAGVVGGLAVGDIGLAFSGGINGLSMDLAKTLAFEFGAGFILGALGLFNPVTLCAVLVGAFVMNWKKGQSNAVKKLKQSIKDKIVNQLSDTADDNSYIMSDEIADKFAEIAQQIVGAMDIEITETENQINSIIEELNKGQESVNERNSVIDKCENSAKVLNEKLDNFIFSLVEQ